MLINPASEMIGRENAILSGSGARYHVRDFEGSLGLPDLLNQIAC
jgi:hypothetical protein